LEREIITEDEEVTTEEEGTTTEEEEITTEEEEMTTEEEEMTTEEEEEFWAVRYIISLDNSLIVNCSMHSFQSRGHVVLFRSSHGRRSLRE
jgi:hypothetical protein